jgi:hypothetical protein
MITGIRNKIDRLVDEGMNTLLFLDMDTDKIADCTRHLAFIPANTTKDIQEKLYICVMLADCESISDYLRAWKANDFAFITANTDKALRLIKKDRGLLNYGCNYDDGWQELYESVTVDIKQFLTTV